MHSLATTNTTYIEPPKHRNSYKLGKNAQMCAEGLFWILRKTLWWTLKHLHHQSHGHPFTITNNVSVGTIKTKPRPRSPKPESLLTPVRHEVRNRNTTRNNDFQLTSSTEFSAFSQTRFGTSGNVRRLN